MTNEKLVPTSCSIDGTTDKVAMPPAMLGGVNTEGSVPEMDVLERSMFATPVKFPRKDEGKVPLTA